ncbi:MAG TPA: hypothetical protein PKD53_31660 [Chloroflexaceae bacterium]|nr:hypothetical protein [Chloroflexaceae bacterium]
MTAMQHKHHRVRASAGGGGDGAPQLQGFDDALANLHRHVGLA